MCDDFPIAYAYTLARTLRLATVPTKSIATRSRRIEIAKHALFLHELRNAMIDVYTWPTRRHKVHIMLEECALP